MNKNNLPRKLNLGCGLHTADDWLNADASINAWLAKHKLIRKILKFLKIKEINEKWPSNIFIWNVKNGLPFLNNYFETVYASHLLEHLYLSEALKFLNECYRVLKSGGTIRLIVPDLRGIIEEYNKNKQKKKLWLPIFSLKD